MTAHSSILGGSNAQRLMVCPASYQELLRSPNADVSSSYADEGSMMHEVVSAEVGGLLVPEHLIANLTQEQRETIDKAKAMLKTFMKAWGGGFRVAAIEETIPFPGVPGSFGTVDLVLASKTHVLVPDWKFGAGVPVTALYELPDGSDMVNPQLAFYAICAKAQRPRLFKNKKIVLAIIQPRLDSLSEVVTDEEELADYQKSMTAAYAEAIGRNPHRERGEHCRFAACKSTCKLWTGPLLDINKMDPTLAALKASQAPALVGQYGEFLSRAMSIAEMAETWSEEIRRQAHIHLSDGGLVPGWKLVPKRGTRKWVKSEAETAEALMEAGIDHADIYTEPELKSVKQVEDAIKSNKKLTIPEELHNMVSTGTTIAHDDDDRPRATHATAIADLRSALNKL
jgi:hypothetical protein